jgi:heat shock protein HslJ
MAQEGDFLAALAKVDTYQMAEGKLQLADATGNPVLTFSALVPVPLVGTVWLFTGYSDGQGSAVSALADTQVTALFGEDGTVSGSAGCNSYTGSYQVEDMAASSGAISFGPVASTMMMCPEPIMAQEMTYLSALESAAGYQIEGNVLTITDAGGTMLLTFVVQEPRSLLGTTWQMTFYNNGKGGFTSAVLGTEVTATFGEDGRVAGSAGCNTYSASFELDGEAISIGPAMTTRMMCAEPEGVMEQETAYLAALESSATYRIEGDKLELWSADGSRMASYVVKAAEAGLSQDALANMEYQSEWTQSGVASLVNGEYREPAAPGSATETVVQLTEHVAYGELAGQPAAAVILVTDPGGSGTFYDLAVVVEEGGQPIHVASTLLGDRVQIVSMDIVGTEIVVEMIAHGPDDPMCCPTQQVVRTFALEGGQLVQTSG